MKSITSQRQLLGLSTSPLFRAVRRWYYRRLENHCLICANIEAQRVKEAQANAKYYQRRAALARSAQHD